MFEVTGNVSMYARVPSSALNWPIKSSRLEGLASFLIIHNTLEENISSRKLSTRILFLTLSSISPYGLPSQLFIFCYLFSVSSN